MSEGGDKSDSRDEVEREFTLVDAFQIGSNLNYLRLAGANRWKVGGVDPNPEGGYILHAIHRSVMRLHDTNLNDTFLDEMVNFGKRIANEYDEEDSIGERDGALLEKKANSWMDRIDSVLSRGKRISVRDHGLFDVERAMEHPEELFQQDVWEWLSYRCQDDIRQACRSLAINCTTASVMVALRAVEDRLRIWYENESGESVDWGSWGAVLGRLSNEYEEDANRPAVLTDLSYLMDRRNEVSHPEKSPDWSEAEDTIYRVRGTINRIYEELGA